MIQLSMENDYMSPTIEKGDVLTIDKDTSNIRNGDAVLARFTRNTGIETIAVTRAYQCDGNICLIPDNIERRADNIFITSFTNNNFKILGKVVEVSRDLETTPDIEQQAV